jgi:DNA-binding transcriptional regulator GbsR (MarR family)
MADDTTKAKEHFIQGMSRIANFWGFPRAMGATYGAIYLSPKPLTLDDIVKEVAISKGAASTNVRQLERFGMVHKHYQLGDRKDYYVAETDFWKIIKGILREREKHEFDQALRTVSESIDMLKAATGKKAKDERISFYSERMREMKKFFDGLDSIVATFLALDELRVSTIKKIFGKKKGR